MKRWEHKSGGNFILWKILEEEEVCMKDMKN
jgi:hypothetical protein